MTTISSNSKTSNKRIMAIIAMLFLSTVGMFAQEVDKKSEVSAVEVIAANDASTDNSQLELVSWFMGTKAVQSTPGTINNTSTNNTGKKQLINCGMTPNRILSRTFMKKAINYDSTVA